MYSVSLLTNVCSHRSSFPAASPGPSKAATLRRYRTGPTGARNRLQKRNFPGTLTVSGTTMLVADPSGRAADIEMSLVHVSWDGNTGRPQVDADSDSSRTTMGALFITHPSKRPPTKKLQRRCTAPQLQAPGRKADRLAARIVKFNRWRTKIPCTWIQQGLPDLEPYLLARAEAERLKIPISPKPQGPRAAGEIHVYGGELPERYRPTWDRCMSPHPEGSPQFDKLDNIDPGVDAIKHDVKERVTPKKPFQKGKDQGDVAYRRRIDVSTNF
jgi:hypothetical protein